MSEIYQISQFLQSCSPGYHSRPLINFLNQWSETSTITDDAIMVLNNSPDNIPMMPKCADILLTTYDKTSATGLWLPLTSDLGPVLGVAIMNPPNTNVMFSDDVEAHTKNVQLVYVMRDGAFITHSHYIPWSQIARLSVVMFCKKYLTGSAITILQSLVTAAREIIGEHRTGTHTTQLTDELRYALNLTGNSEVTCVDVSEKETVETVAMRKELTALQLNNKKLAAKLDTLEKDVKRLTRLINKPN